MSIFEDTVPRVAKNHPLRVAILGSSGSIGTQALDVCRQHADKLKVVGIAVNTAVSSAAKAAQEFDVPNVVISDESRRGDAALADMPAGTVVTYGAKALVDLVQRDDVDCVLNAVVGAAGIEAGYAALKAQKILTYANKESIVIGGDLLMPLAKPGLLLPVDSEHSAIYQCLVGEKRSDVHALWLTCSGGPFFGMSRDELARKTAADALKHPTWSMGSKITIDSATLMNKGLEVIEAMHLFDVPIDAINVLVHRQSRIHSMVEFSDGSVKAQLGPSDMRIPIQYAFSYPERWQTPCERVEYRGLGDFSFAAPDEAAFGCLHLAREAGRTGGTLPCAMNAANEVANLAFRRGICGFLDIERVVEKVMDATDVQRVESLEQLSEADVHARDLARRLLGGEV